MSDHEYAKPVRLADWLGEFAKRMSKNKPKPKSDEFEDIRLLYKEEGGDFDTVEAKVREIRERAGLDIITKQSSLEALEEKLASKHKK